MLLRVHFHDRSLAPLLVLPPMANSWGFHVKRLETTPVDFPLGTEVGPQVPDLLSNHPDLEIPARPPNVSHLTAKTSSTSAILF
jgi:hypothetical protein